MSMSAKTKVWALKQPKPGASRGIPGDADFVSEILGDKIQMPGDNFSPRKYVGYNCRN